MAHTEDPLEQCRKAMSDMADAVFAKASVGDCSSEVR